MCLDKLLLVSEAIKECEVTKLGVVLYKCVKYRDGKLFPMFPKDSNGNHIPQDVFFVGTNKRQKAKIATKNWRVPNYDSGFHCFVSNKDPHGSYHTEFLLSYKHYVLLRVFAKRRFILTAGMIYAMDSYKCVVATQIKITQEDYAGAISRAVKSIGA